MRTLALLLLAAVPLAAQQPRASRPLPAPNLEIEEPWSGPLQLVELRDGNILVHDSREKRLVVVNVETEDQRLAAREGGGPAEYRSVMGMWRAAGDSVMLLDLVQGRLLVLSPDGRGVATRRLPGAGDPMAVMNQPLIRMLDRRGRLYGQAMSISFEGGQMTMGDSMQIIRSDLAAGRADTLTKIPSFQRSPQISPQLMRIPIPGYVPQDAWGVFPDGRVLVVRGRGYTPEIFAATGSASRKAAPLPYPKLSVTAADRRAYMDSVNRAMDEGMRQMAGGMPAGAQMPKIELVEPDPWQTEKPPLMGDLIQVDAKSRAWVPVIDRNPGQRFDLIDGEGRVVEAIKFPPGVALLGFGATSVYTTTRDEDGLMYIRRHPLP